MLVAESRGIVENELLLFLGIVAGNGSFRPSVAILFASSDDNAHNRTWCCAIGPEDPASMAVASVCSASK